MFAGISCNSLIWKDFEGLNGIEINVKSWFPCLLKFGLWMRESYNDKEKYIGIAYIPGDDQFWSYEIPIGLLIQESLRNDMITTTFEDTPDIIGFDLTIQDSVEADFDWCLKTIKVVQIPQYEELKKFHNSPIFFK